MAISQTEIDDVIYRVGEIGTDFNIRQVTIGDAKKGYKKVLVFNIPKASATKSGLLSAEDFVTLSTSGSGNSYFPSGW